MSVITSLENILCRPGVENICREWKNRSYKEGIFRDIYDGKKWQNFRTYNGEELLDAPNTYAFMLNVDWFNPYERTYDVSVGGIYLTLLNLPRHLRFKKENMILVGIWGQVQGFGGWG